LSIKQENVSVVDLKAVSACAGLVPLRIGTVSVDEMDVGVLSSLSPFGDSSEFSGALEIAHGVGWPTVGGTFDKDGVQIIWFGRGEAVLIGPAPDAVLGEHAAVVDVSDAWAVVSIEGADTIDVLARLVPVDLRDHAFAQGHTVRTQLLHLSASITKRGPDRFMILVFRSMAATLIHDLKQAMVGVAARR
jgi:heterotetrameric sarcosine oxidase gamma subunit